MGKKSVTFSSSVHQQDLNVLFIHSPAGRSWRLYGTKCINVFIFAKLGLIIGQKPQWDNHKITALKSWLWPSPVAFTKKAISKVEHNKAYSLWLDILNLPLCCKKWISNPTRLAVHLEHGHPFHHTVLCMWHLIHSVPNRISLCNIYNNEKFWGYTH